MFNRSTVPDVEGSGVIVILVGEKWYSLVSFFKRKAAGLSLLYPLAVLQQSSDGGEALDQALQD